MTNLSPKDKAMKSKNQIIHEVRQYDLPHFSEKVDGEDVLTITIAGCHSCMDQYSEQIAIGFAEWMNDEDCQMTAEGWVMRHTNYDKHHTTKELYNLYIKSLVK